MKKLDGSTLYGKRLRLIDVCIWCNNFLAILTTLSLVIGTSSSSGFLRIFIQLGLHIFGQSYSNLVIDSARMKVYLNL